MLRHQSAQVILNNSTTVNRPVYNVLANLLPRSTHY